MTPSFYTRRFILWMIMRFFLLVVSVSVVMRMPMPVIMMMVLFVGCSASAGLAHDVLLENQRTVSRMTAEFNMDLPLPVSEAASGRLL